MKNVLILFFSICTLSCAAQYNRAHYELLESMGSELPAGWALTDMDTLIFPEVIHLPTIELTFGNPITETDGAMSMVSVYMFNIKDSATVKAFIKDATKDEPGTTPSGTHFIMTKSYIVCILYAIGETKRDVVFNREVKVLVPGLISYFEKHYDQL